MQPDTPHSREVSAVSPLAARLSSIAYMLAFVCLTPILFLFGGIPLLEVLHVLPSEQSGIVEGLLLLIMLVTSLPTIVIAIVALRLMREVSATMVQKARAGQAMAMGFVSLSFPLFLLFLVIFSGGRM